MKDEREDQIAVIRRQLKTPLLLQQRGHPGREPINSEWSADVRFAAHYGLNSDIEFRSEKCQMGDIALV